MAERVTRLMNIQKGLIPAQNSSNSAERKSTQRNATQLNSEQTRAEQTRPAYNICVLFTV